MLTIDAVYDCASLFAVSSEFDDISEDQKSWRFQFSRLINVP